MKYIICYDIQEDKKRNKIAKILLEYGIRTQLSFYEAHLSKKDIFTIIKKVKRLINKDTDVFYIIPLDKKDEKNIKRAGCLHINPVNDIFL